MISDNDLLLYYYRDGLDAAERTRIGAALSERPELAQRLQALVARLDAVSATPEVPVPVEAQRRWEAALERAAHNKDESRVTRMPRANRWSYAPWAAAAAVALVAIILVIPKEHDVETPPVAATPVETDASAYERGLRVHLASTEQQLAGLDSVNPEARARLIETIIAQNRIYALAAERAGEPQLARVLRAFSPVLEDLAHGAGDSSASIAQLSFELRVMQGRLGAGTASTSEPTTL